MKKKILITGGTGFIGKKLAQALFEKEYSIVIFSRNPENSKRLLPFADEHVQWNPSDSEEIIKYFDEAYGVINLAGASIAGRRWSEEYKKEILSSRISVTSNIAYLLNNCTNSPKVCVNASAIGYYGNRGNDLVDERSEAGNDFLSYVCKEWEKAAFTATEKTRVVIGRIGIVLDKQEGALAKMLTPYKYFLGGPLGSGKQWMSWIHIEDLIRLFIYVIENETVSGAVNFVSPEPVQMNEFAKILGKVIRMPSIFRVPEFVLKLLLGEQASIVLEGQRVIPSVALEKGFDYKFKNLKEAIREIISVPI